MTKKNIIAITLLLGLFLGLAIVFGIYDLEISKSFASSNPNLLFRILDALGEFPIYIGPIFFGLVYGFTCKSKNMRLIFHTIGLIGTYIGLIRLSKGIFEVFFSSNLGVLQFSLLAIAALLLYVFFYLLLSKVDRKSLMKISDVALIYLIVVASSFLIVSITKNVWGRTRFRALSDDFSEYSSFLNINFLEGFNGDDYRSFPSGHTNAATSILILSLIPSRLSSKKWICYLTFSFCLLYPIIVAISRVGVGAHYASDVLFGFMISISCFLITHITFKKKGWLNVRSVER